MSVLLVYAQELRLLALELAAHDAGVPVERAHNALSAERRLGSLRPSLIVCAEQLGDASGAQLHAFVRSRADFAKVAFALLSDGGRAPFPLSARDLALDAALPTSELWRRLAPLAGAGENGPEAGRGAQMRGEIAALGLFELLGSLQQTRKTGQLTLHLGELDADFFLHLGEVAHAEYLGLYGEAAFLRAVDAAGELEHAEFTFETLSPGEVSALPRTVERTTERLLLELAVRLDHARAGRSGV